MSTTADRRFADLRAQYDSWVLTQDAESFAGFTDALRAQGGDAPLYFRGYMLGVASRLGVTPPTVARGLELSESRSGAERLADMEAFDAQYPGAFEPFGCGFIAGYFPDHDFGAADEEEGLVAD